jgi:DNA-binding CsgD family transcriptional regulator
VVQTIDAAREACDRHRWGDAVRLVADLDAETFGVDDLDRFATASYLTGHDAQGFTYWANAHQKCVDEGAVHRAAAFGMRLAQGYLFKGDLGRGRGWVDRTARLLEAAEIDCVEQGYLEQARAMLCIFEAGDLTAAHTLFTHAGKIGARFAHRELVTLARIGQGRMLIYLGEIAEGMALLDEAGVSIEAGELSPLATGDAYCTLIEACAELFDLDRCRSWTESLLSWCNTQQDLVLYRGHCFLHRAEVRGLLGEWSEALGEARSACDRLAEPVHPVALGAAHRVEGDLLRLLGDVNGAEAAYRLASEFGCDPQPGVALLRLATDRREAADASIRRALGEAGDPISRARLLGAYVEIVLANGDADAGRAAADEFRRTAAEIGTPLLRAYAGQAAGAVQLADGDATSALIALRRAFNEFNALGVRYDAARTRLLIAEACDALGDHDATKMELNAARSVLDALKSASPTSERASPTSGGLSPRELEVLRLLAQGKSNRVIAQELVLSEKTVASHVSHIFTKLGVTSRSAATAYAYERQLV